MQDLRRGALAERCLFELRIGDYPSSSGFGYAMPSRGKGNGVGALGMLREFEYRVCDQVFRIRVSRHVTSEKKKDLSIYLFTLNLNRKKKITNF